MPTACTRTYSPCMQLSIWLIMSQSKLRVSEGCCFSKKRENSMRIWLKHPSYRFGRRIPSWNSLVDGIFSFGISVDMGIYPSNKGCARYPIVARIRPIETNMLMVSASLDVHESHLSYVTHPSSQTESRPTLLSATCLDRS